MSWWIPMAISAVGSVVGASNQSSQNSNQMAWNQYNANMQFGTDLSNLQSQGAISIFNTQAALAAAQLSSGVTEYVAAYNAGLIESTTAYNDSLLEQELTLLWDSLDLDLAQLENQRAQERGAIVANQSASGTVIGEGSNADTIVHQKTQEAMDATIVRHQADINANEIANARAKNFYEGEMAIQKTIFDGQVSSYATMANARLQAGAQLGQSMLSIGAGFQSAKYNYSSNMTNAQTQYNTNQTTISNNLINGLFGSAAMGATSYFAMKPTTMPGTTINSPVSNNYGVSTPLQTSYKFGTGYSQNYSLASGATGQYSLTQSGASLIQ